MMSKHIFPFHHVKHFTNVFQADRPPTCNLDLVCVFSGLVLTSGSELPLAFSSSCLILRCSGLRRADDYEGNVWVRGMGTAIGHTVLA